MAKPTAEDRCWTAGRLPIVSNHGGERSGLTPGWHTAIDVHFSVSDGRRFTSPPSPIAPQDGRRAL